MDHRLRVRLLHAGRPGNASNAPYPAPATIEPKAAGLRRYSQPAVELPGLLEYRNSANERAERCAGALHTRALQRFGHLRDGCSIGLLPRDLPCQLGLRLPAGTALQVRLPGAQVFDDLAQGPGTRWASLDQG